MWTTVYKVFKTNFPELDLLLELGVMQVAEGDMFISVRNAFASALIACGLLILLCSLLEAEAADCTRMKFRHGRHPQSIVMFKGPTDFYSADQEKPTNGQLALVSIPYLLPETEEVTSAFDHATLHDYLAVTSGSDPSFDGFQIFRVSENAARKFRTYIKNKATRRFSVEHCDVFSFECKMLGLEDCWDFLEQRLSSEILYSFISDDTILVCTSQGYLRREKEWIGFLTTFDLNGKEINTFDPNFYDITRPVTYRAVRFFDKKQGFPRTDLNSKILLIDLVKTGDLFQGPYELLVTTRRRDSIEDAQLVLKEFESIGFSAKSLVRVKPCEFRLTMEETSEYDVFFLTLNLLLAFGDAKYEG